VTLTRATPGIEQIPIVVIADDLTGAADMGAAIVSSRPGSRCVVVPWQRDIETVLDSLARQRRADVVSVSTNSRDCPGPEAAGRVRQVSRWTAQHAQRPIKKIDSLLRGQVALELEAFLEEVGRDGVPAVFCPALPFHGRITAQGEQFQEVPLGHGGPAGRGTLVSVARLADVLPGDHRAVRVELAAVRAGTLIDELAGLRTGRAVLVVDAVNESDMTMISRAVDAAVGVPVIATSGLRDHECPASSAAHGAGVARTLVLSASRSRAVALQLDALLDSPAAGVTVIVSPQDPCAILPEGVRALEALKSHRNAVLAVDPRGPVAATEEQRATDAHRLTATLAIVAHDFLDQASEDDRLVILGGNLAQACVVEAGLPWLRLEGEITPGFVILTYPHAQGPQIAIRSGSFGAPDALVSLLCPALLRIED